MSQATTDLTSLQDRLGVIFRDVNILQQALVHRSYLNENPDFTLESNERLEFLGDALLGLVIAEDLFRRFGDVAEGELTKMRSALVRQDSLAKLASSLGVGDCLYLGQGEEKGGGRKRPRNLACALEALIGAVFIDQGFSSSKEFVLNVFSSSFQRMTEEGLDDYKSSLQELAQARKLGRPVYNLVKMEGPDHDRWFTVEVILGEEVLGSGSGKSKRIAEKEAARQALGRLSSNPDGT